MEPHRWGHGTAPGVGLNRPATPSVSNEPAVADEERTRQKVLRSPWLSTHICRVLGGLMDSILVEVERRSRSGASLHLDVAPFWNFLCLWFESPHFQYLSFMLSKSSFISPSWPELEMKGACAQVVNTNASCRKVTRTFLIARSGHLSDNG